MLAHFPPNEGGSGLKPIECEHTRTWLEALGFSGFVTFAALRTLDFLPVPTDGGVYVLLRESDVVPSFLSVGSGGHFKGRDPNVEVALLERRWISGCQVVYVGKASKTSERRHLRKRLQEFAAFGSGKAVGHWGGRLTWQLEDSADLLVCWKVSDTPRATESDLLRALESEHGSLPYANLVH